MAARKKSSSSHRQPGSASSPGPATAARQLSSAGKRWWGASACLLGTLLVWSLLQPVDAVSVFQGAATAQNLAWLTLATLTAAGCIASGVRYDVPSRWWWLVGGGLLWLLIATVMAGRANNPRVAWYGFWQVVSLGACYYSASVLLPGPRSRRAALQILLVGCVALALQGLEQVLVEMPAARAEYVADPEAFLAQNPDLDLPVGSPMRKRFEDRLLYSSEPNATFALTNSLAVLLTGGLVILCGVGYSMWLDAPRRYSSLHSSLHSSPHSSLQANNAWQRWLPSVALGLAIFVVGVCWFLTRSRVAYLSVGLIGLAWGLANANRLRHHRWLLLGMSTAVGVVLLAGGWWLWHNDRLVFSEAPKSLSYRLEYWVATIAMLRDHPWWGVGLGNFQSYYPFYKLPLASEIVADPHNWLLDLCVSLSLPVGVLLIIWLAGRLLAGLHDSSGEQAIEGAGLDAWSQRCLLWGAAIGGTLCLGLLSLLAGLETSVIAVAWLLAAGLIACLLPLMEGESQSAQRPVNQEAQLDRNAAEAIESLNSLPQFLAGSAAMRRAVCAAVAAMLLCLLASGSWQASGLAVPLLIGLVIVNRSRLVALNSTSWSGTSWTGTSWSAAGAGRDVPPHLAEGSPRPSKPQRIGQVAIVGVPALWLIFFLLQCWRPTVTSWALLQQAQRAYEPRAQLALVEAAAEADGLDTEPLRWRAQMLSGQAMQASGDQFAVLADQALSSLDAWLARDSIKYSNWEVAGRHALQLAEQARRLGLAPQKWLEAAIGYYSRSVARYPSSIGLTAQLAAVLAIAGRWPEAEQWLQVAEELDRATPHADQKLASQQLWLPMLPEGAAVEFARQQPQVMAEPILDWLRKHNAD